MARTSLKEHYQCGRHSGFPLCCVLWYVTGWQLIGRLPHKTITLDDGVVWVLSGPTVWYTKNILWGYVPCPLCIVRKNQVDVISCDCNVDARMRKD